MFFLSSGFLRQIEPGVLFKYAQWKQMNSTPNTEIHKLIREAISNSKKKGAVFHMFKEKAS